METHDVRSKLLAEGKRGARDLEEKIVLWLQRSAAGAGASLFARQITFMPLGG